MMPEAFLTMGFVVLALAAAWTIYKAVHFGARGEMKEVIPYLFAFAVIMFLAMELRP